MSRWCSVRWQLSAAATALLVVLPVYGHGVSAQQVEPGTVGFACERAFEDAIQATDAPAADGGAVADPAWLDATIRQCISPEEWDAAAAQHPEVFNGIDPTTFFAIRCEDPQAGLSGYTACHAHVRAQERTDSTETVTSLLPSVAGLHALEAEVTNGSFKTMLDAFSRWQANPTTGTAERVSVAAGQVQQMLSDHNPYPCYRDLHVRMKMTALLYEGAFDYDIRIPGSATAAQLGQPISETFLTRADEERSNVVALLNTLGDGCIEQARADYGRSWAVFGDPEQYEGVAEPEVPAQGMLNPLESLPHVEGLLQATAAVGFDEMLEAWRKWDSTKKTAPKQRAASELRQAAQHALSVVGGPSPYPCWGAYQSALYGTADAVTTAFAYEDMGRSAKRAKKSGQPISKAAVDYALGWLGRVFELGETVYQGCLDQALGDYLRSYEVLGDPALLFYVEKNEPEP